MLKHNVAQRSDEWHHLRKGKLTGTCIKALMGTPKARQDLIYELVAERLTNGLVEEENPMERGVRLESEALMAFEFETGKKVDSIGFASSDDNEYMAISPDGFIGEDEALEIKCPGGKNYVKMWLTNEVPDEYYWQAVQYFVIHKDLKKLYFVGYFPEIPTHPLHIIELKREKIEENIAKSENEQKKILAEVNIIISTLIEPI